MTDFYLNFHFKFLHCIERNSFLKQFKRHSSNNIYDYITVKTINPN